MLTLLGSLLGFISSTFPDLLNIWKDRADRNHELAILDRQMEAQKLNQSNRLEEIHVQADISESKALYSHASQPSGVPWVEALRATVRPMITYAFFVLFATVKIAALFQLLNSGFTVADSLIIIWDGETQALFAAVMSFWFGQRALTKLREG
jgi:acyl-coenzyme A synthetase/AMP-(fatty) acid ligase